MSKDKKALINLQRLFRRLESSELSGAQWTEFLQYAERELQAAPVSLPAEQRDRYQKALATALAKTVTSETAPAQLPDLRSKLFGLSSGPEDESYEEAERQKLELQQEMLEFAREMKQTAQSFGNVLSRDNQVLSKIAAYQYRYLSEVKTEGKKIEAIVVKTDWFATLKSMIAVIFSLVLFFFMMSFIWMFPSKQYVYVPSAS